MRYFISIICLFCLVAEMNCTTIELDKDHNVPKTYSIDSVFYEETPPASINPLCEIISKRHTESILRFSLRLARQVRWHKKHEHIVTEIRIIFHANDGLNWKRGDIDQAIIYYEESNGS